jgi:glycine cleavage system aminomethyltransferase T
VVTPLDDPLRRAGAHMAERQGWLMAVDFGSVASEVAVSTARAGLADVSSAGKFELRGSEDALAALGAPGIGEGVRSGLSWWCRAGSELLLVVSAPGAREELEEQTAGHAVELTDVTAERVALCLLGPAGKRVLERAGCEVSPVGGVRTESVFGVPTLTLHQDVRRWLLVAPADDAVDLWHGLSSVGAPLGLAHVGADALQHMLAAAERF